MAAFVILAIIVTIFMLVLVFKEFDAVDRRLCVLEKMASSEPVVTGDPIATGDPIVTEVAPPVAARFDVATFFESRTSEAAAAGDAAAPVDKPAIEPPVERAPKPAKAEPAIDWELFAGGKLLNVIGAIVLVIGVGLLLKYAWDENWVIVPVRIGAGVLAGLALLFGGHVSHVRAKSKWFEHGLFGAGIGILYATGYSAFAGYHIVPFSAAYAFMSIVTLSAFALSVRYRSLPMALIGWAGGFATPFAISDGSDNALGLASYIVLLDIGLLAVSLYRRAWFALAPLAVGASYITAAVWYWQHLDNLSAFVSSLAIASMWLVFFAAGVAQTVADGVVPASFELLIKRATAVANALCFWGFERTILGEHSTAFAELSLCAAVAYIVAYAICVRRIAAAMFERAGYAAGAVSLVVAATAASFHHFDLVTMFALEAIAIGVIVNRARVFGADVAALREGAGAAYALLGAGILALLGPNAGSDSGLGMPDVMAFAGTQWSFGFGGRDLMLAILFAAFVATDRLSRGARFPAFPAIAARQLALLTVAAFESVHTSAYGLSAWYTIDAIALVALDRGMRTIRRSYAAPPEALLGSLCFLCAAAVSFAITPDALAGAANSWDGHFGSRDLVLLAIATIALVLDRMVRGDSKAFAFDVVFRQIAVGALIVLDTLHCRDLGLATIFALEAIVFVIIDRTLARYGNAYAPHREPSIVAGAFAFFGWIVLAFTEMPGQFIGEHLALGFGRIDLALLALSCAAIAIGRNYHHQLESLLSGALRLSVVLAAGVFALVHFSGFHFGEALALEALAFALFGTRAAYREVEIAGLVFLASAVTSMLLAPDAWHAADIFRFAPFRSERFFSMLTTSVLMFVTGEVYRRRSTLSPWTGKTARLAGVALATIAVTVEVRDLFELAIANARLATPSDIDLMARLVNGEGLGTSAVWIAASILTIAAGIAFRVREFRVAAIALFDLTILKAFFVDLSSLTTPYRIVSFIGLGLVLLGVSYFYQRLEHGRTTPGPVLDDALEQRAA